MKHKFLLDVMILYHAVKGVDDHENPDPTAAEFIRLVRENCHTITADHVLAEKYSAHIKKLFANPSLQFAAVNFFLDVLTNSAKFAVEASSAPALPAGVKVPKEDEYVVRAALVSRPIVVTSEERLLKAINNQEAQLALRALHPREAIELAKDR